MAGLRPQQLVTLFCAVMTLHFSGLALATSPPQTFFSELALCPAPCGSTSPRDWTVYSSATRLSRCEEPMLFDLNIYNSLEDATNTHNVRACTFRGELPKMLATGESGVEARVCPSATMSTAVLEMGYRGSPAKPKDVASALGSVRGYLGATSDCSKQIMLGYSNGTVVGVYVGRAISKQAADAAIDQLQSQAQSGASAGMAVQLCGDSRDRDHVLGIAIAMDGDIAAAQASLAAWNNGTCAGGFDRAVRLPPIGLLETRQVDRSLAALASNSSFAYASSHRRQSLNDAAPRLSPRASGYCTTEEVESGDSCWSLANACGISLNDFYKYNDEKKCSSLQVGQKVCCNAGSLKPLPQDNGDCYTHTVEAGDNCYEIGLPWNLSMDDVAGFNDKKTWGWSGCGNLPVGLEICLSSGYPPAPAELANAVCGPQMPGTKFDGQITDTEALKELNPCPLNSCCNIWGQCGIDDSFCTKSIGPTGNPGTSQPGIFGCISNCGTDIVSSESPPAQFQRVGYYETFNWGRKCLHQRAAWSDTIGYTHMHWAFGSIDRDMNVFVDDEHGQWDGFMSLNNVKRIASFGGWGFSTDVGTYDILRAAMAPENRDRFVASLVAFADSTGVDGIDFDWEYPGAPDIPGIPPGLPSDTANYLATLKALRRALPDRLSISIAAPASFWYLRPFAIKEMAEVIDYIVFMAYDLHGQWDYGSAWASTGCPSGNCLRSHVNQTEVLLGLSMITKAGVPSTKIMVGESSYGRSFKMANAGCTGPNCLYTGSSGQSDAMPGRCTDTAGYLANAEISEIIADKSRNPQTWYDDETASDYLVYDDLQWVAYMSGETKDSRREKWKGLNFLGTIDWATDLQEFTAADALGPSGDYEANTCINVFDDMIWNWVNPAIAAPVNCTNLLQASPLPTVVTLTASTTITLVSGGQVSTRALSTAFAVSEVNFQPFTIGEADIADNSVLVYHPVPRVTAEPLALAVPPGWTMVTPASQAPPTKTLIGAPASGTATSSDGAGLLLLPWLPTVSYPLPPIITPKPVAPLTLPADDRSPVPTPDPGVRDCAGPGCARGNECVGDACVRGGDCVGPACTAGGGCRGPRCVRGGQCIGDACTEGGGCDGDACVEGGGCSGAACRRGGVCKGLTCNKGGDCVKTPSDSCGSGGCTGPQCGCVGMWCGNRVTISVLPPTLPTPVPVPTCLVGCPALPTCGDGGVDCNKPCNLRQCPPGRMPTAPWCSTLATARDCTEFVSSTAVQTAPTTSWSTTTRTRCATALECDARDTTTTTTQTTSEEPDPTASTVEFIDYVDDGTAAQAVFDAIGADYDEWLKTADAATTKKPDPTPAPEPVQPSALCGMWDAYIMWQFQIVAVGWAEDGGKKLHKEMSGCGSIATWDWQEAHDGQAPRVDFTLPFLMKDGCVERAIVSAGGPRIECEKMGAMPIRRGASPGASGPRVVVVELRLTRPRPLSAEERERAVRFYGLPSSTVHEYVPMHWNTTNTTAVIG